MTGRKAYPTFIKENEGEYLVYVPDLGIYTEGDSFENAIEMARDAIGLKGIDFEDDQKALPGMSSPDEALRKAQEDADEDFDYSDGILTYVDVDLTAYRNRMKNRAVKKNCTIPYWLSEAAEKAGVNFSKVLQEALMQKLNTV